jgi:hypothetical protein
VCSLAELFACLRQLSKSQFSDCILLCIDGVHKMLSCLEGVNARIKAAATLMQLVNKLMEKNRLLVVMISKCISAGRVSQLGSTFNQFFTEQVKV